MASVRGHVSEGAVVWVGRPWVVPAAVIRTAAVVLAAAGVLFLETYVGLAGFLLAGLPLYVWTLLAFGLVWAAGMAGLLVFYASNSYMLRRDGLEVRRGIIRLHSFVVTPSGFGDLLLYQGIGGRIFGYGDLTVNSQGNRQTKLSLVRSPYKTAETIRDVMGKPIFRAENHV